MRGRRSRYLVLVAVLMLASAPAIGASEEAAPRAGSARWGADYFPNVPLITQDGETVHFFDDLIEDKVVAINFIYTSCRDSCPLETARMAEVQRILGDRVGQDVFMYSITIDPERDTPEVLTKYAKQFKAGAGWTFLTGQEADITLLRRKLGLYIDEIQDGSNDHNLSLIIGNQGTGRWMKRSPFENPYILASQIGGWLHNWKLPREGGNDYADAPKLRGISKGESLFRTRCATCHSFGGGDVALDAQRVGPDLLGVTKRRDREWLARWLADPEGMLEAKDPIALELYAAFGNVMMPNARLNELEVNSLLEYLAEETRRVEMANAARRQASAPKAHVHDQHGHGSHVHDAHAHDHHADGHH